MTPEARAKLQNLIAAIENELLDSESFANKARAALEPGTCASSDWVRGVILASIEDHGYWGSPFASYSEVTDLKAIEYLLAKGDLPGPVLSLSDFGASADRARSIDAAVRAMSDFHGWSGPSRVRYLSRILERVVAKPKSFILIESLPRVLDLPDDDLDPIEMDVRHGLTRLSRAGCLLPALSRTPKVSRLRQLHERLLTEVDEDL